MVAFVVAAALLLHLAAAVLRPAHTDYGSTWRDYLCEPEQSIDVLFLGSSYAYCDWNPGVMYASSGLTGSVMGGSVTLIDSGREAALALASALREQDLLCDGNSPRRASYFVTDDPEGFTSVAGLFLGHSIDGRTERISIEKM